jgi:hypothetical protein
MTVQDSFGLTPTDDDQVIPSEVWRPMIEAYFASAVQDDPDWFDLEAIRGADMEVFRVIIEKAHELDQLGAAPAGVILRAYYELHGLFSQSSWRRKGYRQDELFLDAHGHVLAVRIHSRFGRRVKPHIHKLVGCWATTDKDFRSPDGAPVFQQEEIARLNAMSDDEQIALIERKFQ